MKEIRFCGSGGQGIISMAIILAEALTEQDMQVVQTQAYGPEARGGASRADVITDQCKIYYPKVRKPDILIAMNQEACDKYVKTLEDDGILIVDSTFVLNLPQCNAKVYAMPITQLAREKLGSPLYGNIIAIGFLAKLSKIIDQQVLKEIVAKKFPKHAMEKNLQALELGWNIQ